jgi:hypothetical protein
LPVFTVTAPKSKYNAGSNYRPYGLPWETIHMTDLFEQTVQVLVTLAMSADAELTDMALNREVDPLIDAYLVWARTRRPAGFRPKDYNERDELARAFWDKVPPTQISERIRARVARRIDV